MLYTPSSTRGMVTAPHHLAAQAGLAVLRDGGNAIEAALAAAAAIAVVYPHMNSLGGDGFWLIHKPGAAPRAISACGRAGAGVTTDFYRDRGLDAIPLRGPLGACSMAAALSGWDAAHRLSRDWGGKLPLSRLLEEAIFHAAEGFPVTESQSDTTAAKLDELAPQPGFAQVFLAGGQAPAAGSRFKQPALAETLKAIAAQGPEDFYRGALAQKVAADLARAGSPLTLADLESHQVEEVTPLQVPVTGATLYNMTPPTQGLASLLILALYDRAGPAAEAEGFDYYHRLVEATKQALILRDREVADPDLMPAPAQDFLSEAALAPLAAAIDPQRALPWPAPPSAGDTVWLGAMDADGISVSYIQSIFWEFGSGLVLPETGIVWQNRGASLTLREGDRRAAGPGRKPFHTLNPAMAVFDDGRVLSYGCMGGEGQPQTQAALYSRYAVHGQGLQQAITAPRWLIGRTWGAETTTLKLENRIDPAVAAALAEAGHEVEMLGAFDGQMGHAGALLRRPGGILEGATDPRSDGGVAAF